MAGMVAEQYGPGDYDCLGVTDLKRFYSCSTNSSSSKSAS
jgi:hypothetical protein